MEMKNPIFLIVGLIILVIVFFIGRKQRIKYKTGKRIANTRYLRESNYFKTQIRKYKIFNIIIISIYVIIVMFSLVLVARPIKVSSRNSQMKTRDIFLCLDVSTSCSELDLQLVNEFRKTLADVDGERIGIVIFNCTPNLLCPLTEDYEYVDSILEKLTKGFEVVNDYYNSFFPRLSNQDNLDLAYIFSGTTEDDSRGSSLIGDALAATAFDFPKYDEDRTRIIMLATDNDLAGEPLISLTDAAKICMDKKITIFGIGPGRGYSRNFMTPEEEQEFRGVCEAAGGKLYQLGNSVNSNTMHNIFVDIEKTEAKIIEGNPITTVTDIPEKPFAIIIVSTIILIIIKEKEKI